MSYQINYYNQNISFPRVIPSIQNSFNSARSKNGFNINNNLNNFNKNNGLANSYNKNSYQQIYINNKLNYFNEVAVLNSSIISKEQTIKILNQLNKNICKICKPNNHSATGFFCKIPVFNLILPVLITNSTILNKDDIKVNRIIKIALLEKEKEIENKKEIQIVINEPRITFTDEQLGITIIEIIPKVDGITDFLKVS